MRDSGENDGLLAVLTQDSTQEHFFKVISSLKNVCGESLIKGFSLFSSFLKKPKLSKNLYGQCKKKLVI